MKYSLLAIAVLVSPLAANANRSFENVERVIRCYDPQFGQHFSGIKFKSFTEPFCDPTNRRLSEIKNGKCVFVKDPKCGTSNFFVEEEPNPEFEVKNMKF